ncbi:uncharacterized protein [Triticum aestivum]|uniref:uncharacterized protein n=1 Tax=Triticum aestivum TaxID=4565 RepID=UPI001D00C2B5|nr:uncharacterized protein LOC123047122 [Triticum aestivum]
MGLLSIPPANRRRRRSTLPPIHRAPRRRRRSTVSLLPPLLFFPLESVPSALSRPRPDTLLLDAARPSATAELAERVAASAGRLHLHPSQRKGGRGRDRGAAHLSVESKFVRKEIGYTKSSPQTKSGHEEASSKQFNLARNTHTQEQNCLL